MGINKTYAVFGLGRYGIAVANELVSKGAEAIVCYPPKIKKSE